MLRTTKSHFSQKINNHPDQYVTFDFPLIFFSASSMATGSPFWIVENPQDGMLYITINLRYTKYTTYHTDHSHQASPAYITSAFSSSHSIHDLRYELPCRTVLLSPTTHYVAFQIGQLLLPLKMYNLLVAFELSSLQHLNVVSP